MTDDQKFALLGELHSQVEDYFLKQYMKVSRHDMDTKIRVLQERIAGKTPPEIGPDWEKIQEED